MQTIGMDAYFLEEFKSESRRRGHGELAARMAAQAAEERPCGRGLAAPEGAPLLVRAAAAAYRGATGTGACGAPRVTPAASARAAHGDIKFRRQLNLLIGEYYYGAVKPAVSYASGNMQTIGMDAYFLEEFKSESRRRGHGELAARMAAQAAEERPCGRGLAAPEGAPLLVRAAAAAYRGATGTGACGAPRVTPAASARAAHGDIKFRRQLNLLIGEYYYGAVKPAVSYASGNMQTIGMDAYFLEEFKSESRRRGHGELAARMAAQAAEERPCGRGLAAPEGAPLLVRAAAAAYRGATGTGACGAPRVTPAASARAAHGDIKFRRQLNLLIGEYYYGAVKPAVSYASGNMQTIGMDAYFLEEFKSESRRRGHGELAARMAAQAAEERPCGRGLAAPEGAPLLVRAAAAAYRGATGTGACGAPRVTPAASARAAHGDIKFRRQL
ncbi:uncharacterized protein LOC124798903 [Schistocerca piceifrons]|uniref:uncharacterized protein LOC124798903 n=1 Tax=Schistocerca piceifrons TaxID=274613 RepID=UPI001F5EB876|nr:uncharacterized protein LOC124798903 [Schistocerca piceifrons]